MKSEWGSLLKREALEGEAREMLVTLEALRFRV